MSSENLPSENLPAISNEFTEPTVEIENIETLELSVPSPLGLDPGELRLTSIPIYCSRSGVTLGTFTTYLTEGRDAVVSEWKSQAILHPFYALPIPVLHKKLDSALLSAMDLDWKLPPYACLRIQLLTSAILHALEVVKQDRPCLPTWKVAAGTADRVLQFSRWYHEKTSRRNNLPTFSVSSRNNNLDWSNLKDYVGELYEIKKLWSRRVRELELQEEQSVATQKANDAIRKSIFKRIDLRKVWNWIELQFDGEIPARDIKIFKELFLEGDLNAYEWKIVDLEEFSSALVDYCDLGNDITVFIHERIKLLRIMIEEYAQGFTMIVSARNEDGSFKEVEQTSEEVQLLADLDAKLEALGELPPEPKRADFVSAGLFYKAQAQWSLLKRRLDSRASK